MFKFKGNERIGEKHINNYGNEFEIVEYKNADKVTVEFECGYRTVVTYQNCQLGRVSCPYDKRYNGVACMGLMSDGTDPVAVINGKQTRQYILWMSMINRCYNESQLKNSPAYRKCSVCDRWLVYANFLEDLPKIPNYNIWMNRSDYELDKDMLQQDKEFRVYSPETCAFIPYDVNIRMAHKTPRAKKEKPYKPVKVIRVTDVETGVYVDAKKQREVAEMFGFTQTYVSKLIKKGKCYVGYKIEVLYV